MEVSWRHRITIGVLIVGVCCFALTPAMYLVFRALRWQQALSILEATFFPSFILFGTGALFAYRRSQARRMPPAEDAAD
jgi:hypothetical protein